MNNQITYQSTQQNAKSQRHQRPHRMIPAWNNRFVPQHQNQQDQQSHSNNHNEDTFALLMTPPPVRVGNTVYRNSTSQTHHHQTRQQNQTRLKYSGSKGHPNSTSRSKPPPLVTRPSMISINTSNNPKCRQDGGASQDVRGFDWTRHFPSGHFQPLIVTMNPQNETPPQSSQTPFLCQDMQFPEVASSLNPESQVFTPSIPLRYMPSSYPDTVTTPRCQQSQQHSRQSQPRQCQYPPGQYYQYLHLPSQQQACPQVQSVPPRQPHPTHSQLLQREPEPRPEPSVPSQSVQAEVITNQTASSVKVQVKAKKVDVQNSSTNREHPDTDSDDDCDDNICIVCMENPRDASLIHGDSGHIICCLGCANALKAQGDLCPVCRAPIDLVVKNYYG